MGILAGTPPVPTQRKQLNVFERYLTLWVGLCMIAGVLLGRWTPGVVQVLRQMEFGDGSQVNVPIAVLIWLMIIPMMMKVDFTSIRNVGKRPRGRRRHQFACSADLTKKENGLCLPVLSSNYHSLIVT